MIGDYFNYYTAENNEDLELSHLETDRALLDVIIGTLKRLANEALVAENWDEFFARAKMLEELHEYKFLRDDDEPITADGLTAKDLEK